MSRPRSREDGLSGASSLPPQLEALVRRVLNASGLELPARAEVEGDLRAHFEDGLDRGIPTAELITRFGDPEVAGRRIASSFPRGPRDSRGGSGRWWASPAHWWTEARRASRRLARTPGFVAVVVVTLALGVGANTAIFSVLDAVLIRPLPYRDPGQLVRIYSTDEEAPGDINYLRAPVVAAYRTWDDVFSGAAGLYTYRETGADLTEGGRTNRVVTVPVTAGYFETLGVTPELGRTFRDEESVVPGEAAEASDRGKPIAPVAILSSALWHSHFGSSRDVLGETILLDDVAFEVVGVMPAGFNDPFGPRADVWTPQDIRTGGRNNWGNFFLSGVGRLKPGLTLSAAQARVDADFRRLAEANPDAGSRQVLRLVPLHDDLVGSTRRTMLLILAAAAGLVLLTACLNLANLLFARSLGRDHDIAVRAALGSGRGRIVAGLLLETAVLAVLGGVLGLLLGWAGVRGLMALAPDALPVVARTHVQSGALGFALLATLLALVLSGLAPALRISRTPPVEAMRSEGRSTTVGRRSRRLRDALVVVQVAAALVLVAGAALLGRSFATLRDVPLGVDPTGVLTFEVNLPTGRYPDGPSRQRFHRTFEDRLAQLPEVSAAGAASWLPLSGRYNIWSFYWNPENPDGYQGDTGWHNSDIRVFAGDYFNVLGIPLLRGTPPDGVDLHGERVVWVSRRLVKEVFPDVDPLGQRIRVGGDVRRIVGVVDDVAYDAEGDVSRTIYIPHAQFSDDRNWTLTQTVKARGDLGAARGDIRKILAEMDPQLVLYRTRPFTDVVASARAQGRFATALMATFAALALLLALVGTYGVLTWAVTARMREFGIRIALGADREEVRRLVLGHAGRLVLPGIALGLVGAWASGHWLGMLLFKVQPGDPVAYMGAAVLFLIVGLVAGWGPARRATGVDPARTLTSE